MDDGALIIKPAEGRAAVYADIDGTLSRTNIVQPLLWFGLKCFHFPANLYRIAKIIFLCPYWLYLDKKNREKSNISIYRQYCGILVESFKRNKNEYYEKIFKPRIYADAIKTLERFRKNGYSIVLVTGGVDELVLPFAKDLDAEIFAISLETKNGIFTGNIIGKPLTGKAKSEIVRMHAMKHGLDIKNCYALGDAYGDLEMLETVGNPVAVNPDKRLLKVARQRGWQIIYWQ